MTVTVNGTTGLIFNDGSSQATAASGFGFKNRIINGDMRIDQRNSGATVTINSGSAYMYALDRWAGFGKASAGVFTIQRSFVAPAGFTNSALLTVTTAATPVAGDNYGFRQAIEGFNFSDFGWGTANAQNAVLSFSIRSSVTGTFGGSVFSNVTADAFPFTFTIAAANTWQQVSVQIPGRTSGTFASDNSNGLNVWIGLGSGTTATANAWNTSGTIYPSGAANLISTVGATLYITGVQLEKGSTATSFDYRPYGTELALCQRYYYRSHAIYRDGGATTGGYMTTEWALPVTMRAIGTASVFGYVSGTAGRVSYFNGSWVDTPNFSFPHIGPNYLSIQYNNVAVSQMGLSFAVSAEL